MPDSTPLRGRSLPLSPLRSADWVKSKIDDDMKNTLSSYKLYQTGRNVSESGRPQAVWESG